MHFLMPLASLLGIEFDGLAERLRAMAISYGVMAFCGLLGFGFLLAAAFILVAAQTGALYATVIFAAIFLLIGLAVFVGTKIGEGRHRRAMKERRRSGEKGALLATAASTALPLVMRSPLVVKLGLPLVALAVFAITRGGSDD